MIRFDVLGAPAPKGSSRAFVNRATGRAILVPSGSDQNKVRRQSWDVAVREAARAAVGAITAPAYVNYPLAVEIVFRMPRPSGHWSRRGGVKPGAPDYPAVKPDLDKLARSTLDALSGIVFDDDARIVRLVVDKRYAIPGAEGATIRVTTQIEAVSHEVSATTWQTNMTLKGMPKWDRNA